MRTRRVTCSKQCSTRSSRDVRAVFVVTPVCTVTPTAWRVNEPLRDTAAQPFHQVNYRVRPQTPVTWSLLQRATAVVARNPLDAAPRFGLTY
jgi:hypothetical protein